MLNTPVLLIIFNRPKTTKQVFEAIRKVKPKQLFIAADGPRHEKIGEVERCQSARKIATDVDWECEVKTFFRNENVGCGRGPAEAITWFFENVEQGIILEDDCLPSSSFFRFCEELLERYKFDQRIHSIAGTNLLESWKRGDESYFFSMYSGIWGWATWKRSWMCFDYFVSKWQYKEVVDLYKQKISNPVERLHYITALDKTFKRDNVSWWDYQWIFSRIINSSIGIIPSVNLISNIGFGDDATHTFNTNSDFSKLVVSELDFPLQHPNAILADTEYDQLISNNCYPTKVEQTILSKIKAKLGKIIEND
jgi:hypothetical protein